MHLNKMKTFEAKARRESEMKFYNVVKVGLSELERGGVAPPPTAPERRPPRAPIPAPSTAHAGGRAAGARPRTLHPLTCDLEVWQGPPESESKVLVDVCPLGAHSPGGLSSVAPHRATSGSAGTGPSLPLPPSPGLCPTCPGCVLPRLALPSRWTRSQGFGFKSELCLQQLGGLSTLPCFGFPAFPSEGRWARWDGSRNSSPPPCTWMVPGSPSLGAGRVEACCLGGFPGTEPGTGAAGQLRG